MEDPLEFSSSNQCLRPVSREKSVLVLLPFAVTLLKVCPAVTG